MPFAAGQLAAFLSGVPPGSLLTSRTSFALAALDADR